MSVKTKPDSSEVIVSLSSNEISAYLVSLHGWFKQHEADDPKNTIRDSIAIAQRALLSNNIHVEDKAALLDIVIDELFTFDKDKEPLVRKAAAAVWK